MASRLSIPAFISIISGVLLVSLISALAGFYVYDKKIWPYAQVKQTAQIIRSYLVYGEFVAEGRRHPAPEGAARQAATLHDPARSIGEGYYALMAWDNARRAYSVFLHGADGGLLHTWPVDEMALTDRAAHRQNSPHAMEVLPDGSVLVSFDKLDLMARLGPCGKAHWTRQGAFHHSFSPSARGGIWTWYGERTMRDQIQDILEFDPMTGEDMRRISLNEDVIMRSRDSALVFSMFEDFPFSTRENAIDLFHPNDVEELSPELAHAFPMFEAGDLMLSLHTMNMVVVIAPTGEVKWYQGGPWVTPHDPDFEPDGRIAVYNNSLFRPRSSIFAIDPETREVENAMAAFDGPFKSEFRGKHQLLPNGNRLVTIPEQGQAIEVAPDGSVAMEFNNVVPHMPHLNDNLVNAKWLPAGFFE
ncbi:MAG: arylsulfotransferase family protein, partial [Leisingera sp.]